MSIFKKLLKPIESVVGAGAGALFKIAPRPVKIWITSKVAGVFASKIGRALRDQVREEKKTMASIPPGAKPGYKTTEFWLTFLAQMVGFAYMSGAIGDGTLIAKILGLIVSMLTAAGYSVSRGDAKSGAGDSKPGWKTTEFWLTLASTAVAVITTSGALVAGTMVERVVGIAATLLGLLGYQASRGKAKALPVI